MRNRTLAANQLNFHIQCASPAGTQPAPPQEPHRSLGTLYSRTWINLSTLRSRWTVPTPWPSPSPKPPAQPQVKSLGVQSGRPMEICQTTSEWGPVTFYSQAPSSSPADMKAGPWRWCHGRIHRREQPWRGKKPTAPAEPQPELHMGCLWEQNSQLRQGTFII